MDIFFIKPNAFIGKSYKFLNDFIYYKLTNYIFSPYKDIMDANPLIFECADCLYYSLTW